MIRSFIAIAIPAGIEKGLEAVASDLKQLRINARFTRVTSIHLTLKFLGDIEASRVERIGQVLEKSAQKIGRFTVSIEGVGVFPSLKRPRIVWVGVREEPMLVSLQRDIESNLEILDFEVEKRLFKPHLTLARIKSSKGLPDLRAYLEDEGPEFAIGSFEVHDFHLYQSILRPQGAEYRQLSTHALCAE